MCKTETLKTTEATKSSAQNKPPRVKTHLRTHEHSPSCVAPSIFSVFQLVLLSRFHRPLLHRSAQPLWKQLQPRRSRGNPSRAPLRAPWPAAPNVRPEEPFFSLSLMCLYDQSLTPPSTSSSPACDDVLSPAAVADSAVKVLNSCLANMPAGRTPTHKLVNVRAVIFCPWFEMAYSVKCVLSSKLIAKQILNAH